MSVQTDFLDIGFLVSDNDCRNSTITGTTLMGPSGSGQYLVVRVSTVNSMAFALSTVQGSSQFTLGILQNKPSTGIAGDIKCWGVSKVVCGSTGTPGAITVGAKLTLSATSSGTVQVFSSTSGFAIGVALEAPTSVGQVFSAVIYGPGGVGLNGLATGIGV